MASDPASGSDDLDRLFSSSTRLARELDGTAKSFGRSISDAFAKGVIEGKRFEDVLRSIGKSLAGSALKAAFKPLENAISQGFSDLFKSLSVGAGQIFGGAGGGVPISVIPSALGNVFQAGQVRPFAQGGVIAQPTYFPLGRQIGLMGERGAEAIVPLARGPDGRLGIRSQGPAASASITVNIATPDAESFRRSEAQVSAGLARAVARGQRGL